MKRLFSIVTILAIVLSLGVTVSTSSQSEQHASAASVYDVKIGFVGDSITVGVHGSSTNAVQSEMSNLGSHYADVNRGMGGTTTADWQPNLDLFDDAVTIFKSEGVQVVSIMLGANDAPKDSVTPEEYGQNMKKIIEGLLDKAQVKYVIVNYPTYITKSRVNGDISADLASHYNDRLQLFAKELDKLINGTTIIKGDTEAFHYFKNHQDEVSDGVHLTTAGYEHLGVLWAIAFKNFLATHHI